MSSFRMTWSDAVDSGQQIDHAYGGERESLWGLSLMALQLWNAIRSVDFLETLPDVDQRSDWLHRRIGWRNTDVHAHGG